MVPCFKTHFGLVWNQFLTIYYVKIFTIKNWTVTRIWHSEKGKKERSLVKKILKYELSAIILQPLTNVKNISAWMEILQGRVWKNKKLKNTIEVWKAKKWTIEQNQITIR